MKTIPVKLKDHSYDVVIGAPLIHFGWVLRKAFAHSRALPTRALIVTNPFLKKHYAGTIEKSLNNSGIHAEFEVIPAGEAAKNLKTVENLYRACIKAQLDRSSVIVALGGGVIGDIAGFVASTYLRGIAVAQIPTTLLAMVDSAIGGKTGVDLKEAKNFVGAFHQPKLVWCDLSVLKTLPEREFINGMAEVIKYGVIKDPALFKLLESEAPVSIRNPKLTEIISRCAMIKAEVVSKDEKETKGLREILNFGHTIGHAVETATQYKDYKHGEAVAIGMCAAGEIAVILKLWDRRELDRMKNFLNKSKLPVCLKKNLSSQKLLSILARDKKMSAGQLRFVLPVRIGKVTVRKISSGEALAGIYSIQP